MKLSVALFGFAVTAASALPIEAQITSVPATFTSGNVAPDPGVISQGPTGGAYYVGPYTGTLQLGATTNQVIFNCVDFFHDVSNGESWLANLVNLGTGAGIGTNNGNSLTRLYGTASTDNGVVVTALSVYRAAAYLTSQYPAQPSLNAALTKSIQNEIWQMTSLFYPAMADDEDGAYLTKSTRTDGYSYTPPLSVTDLAAHILNYSTVANFDYANYWVVTSATPNPDSPTSAQEFIVRQTVSPEPATIALLGSGMLGIFGSGLVRRRRNRVAVA